MARQVAMKRKGSFMDDLPAGPAMGGGAEDPMTMGFDEYVPGYEGEMDGMDDMDEAYEEAEDMDFDMETRIAALEDRIAQLESMLAG